MGTVRPCPPSLTGGRAALRRLGTTSAAVELSGLAVILALTGVVYSRGLHAAPNYDEGVYLASLDALRHGGRLAAGVFTSQPPGFYVLLQGIAAPAGPSVHAVRLGFLALALLGVAAAWLLGRELAGPRGGLATATVYAVAPALAAGATIVEADLASVALSVIALAAFAVATKRGLPAAAVAAGALAAAAVSVKLFAPPLLLGAAGMALAGEQRLRRAMLALSGAFVVVSALCLVYARDLGAIWNDAVVFQFRGGGDLTANWQMIRAIVEPRTPYTYLAVAGALVAIVAVRERELAGLWLAVPASTAFLLTRPNVLEHHRVLLAAALALAAGASLSQAPAKLVAIPVGLALAAGLVQQWHRLGPASPTPYYQRWAASELQARTPPGALIATDMPIVAHLAQRDLPGELVDTSFARFAAGSLTNQAVLHILARDHIRVLALGRAIYAREDLRRAIERRYRVVARRPGAVIYVQAP